MMPPADVVDQLRPQWTLTSVHEAGHAVAQVVAGLPLYDVRIFYRSSRFGRWWRVNGDTRMSRHGGMSLDHSDTPSFDGIVIAALAGPEAEARWLHQSTGCALRVTRARVAREHQDGDLKRVRRYLRYSSRSPAESDQIAASLVHDWWPAIVRVAAELSARHQISGTTVQRMVHRWHAPCRRVGRPHRMDERGIAVDQPR